MGTGRDWIEIARQQERKLTWLADTPGDLTGLVAGAEIEISAGRPHNGGTGVLGNHGAAEWSACRRARNRKIRLNEKRRAIDVQCLVYRNRTAGRESDSLGAERFAVIVQPDDAKKYHGPILPTHVPGILRIGLHPLPDSVHRHFFTRNDITIDQHATDRHVGVAIVSGVVEAQQGSVF